MICKKKKTKQLKYSVQQVENKNSVDKKKKKENKRKQQKGGGAGHDNRQRNCSRNEVTGKSGIAVTFTHAKKGHPRLPPATYSRRAVQTGKALFNISNYFQFFPFSY